MVGKSLYCISDFLFSAEKHVTQIHPEATEGVRGTHLHLFSLPVYLHSIAVGENRLRAVSLLPGLQGRYHILVTATPMTLLCLLLQNKLLELISS